MTGRHSNGRAGTRIGAPLPIMAALLVLIVTAWFTFQFLSEQLGRPGCANPATIEVAAEPAIAPVLAEQAARLDAERGDSPQHCYQLSVLSLPASTVADRLTGVETGAQPDVWVPDSTFWLRRARAGGAIDLPEAGASLATSPVVLAVAEPAARQWGWPQRPLQWRDVLGAGTEAFTVALPDPARNPVGLSTLFGVRTVAATDPQPATAQVAALRRLSPNVSTGAAELFTKLPSVADPEADPAAAAPTITAFPASEQSLLMHNTQRQQRLVPVYLDPAVPALDYPYVVLPAASEVERRGAERFLEVLLEQDAQPAMQSRGLRTPGGDAGADFPGGQAGRPAFVQPVQLPDRDAVDEVLRVWTGVNLSGRILTLIDVSGSMQARVPGTDLNRVQITALAAKQGLALFKDTTDMGIWVFSSNLDGDRDYRKLAPISPLSTERARLAALVDQVPGLVGGTTNLYDTLLAGYQEVLQGWDAARLNVLIVLTDGRDDDVSQIGRDKLVEELTALQDPKRPTRIIFVGMGPDVDAAELDQIASATGGRAFTTPDPAGIRTVVAAALAELTCVPPACTPR